MAEALDNAQDISPALEATEDFLHCLDGIYDRNRSQNHAAERQDASNKGGGRKRRLLCFQGLRCCVETVAQCVCVYIRAGGKRLFIK